MMYKVLIADDESIIRNTLASAFKWEDYGMQVIGLGKNGVETLELFKTLKPDICLLDIQMPLLNGLELINKMNAIDKSSIKVIISGYDEFEYARKAVEYGVYKYILKPIDEDDFDFLLKEIKEKLDEAKLSDAARSRQDKMLYAKKQLLRDELLSSWILDNQQIEGQGGTSTGEWFNTLGIQLAQTMGMIRVSINYPIGILDNERLKKEQIEECRRRLEAHFIDDASFCFIPLFSDCFLLLCSVCDMDRWDNIKQEVSSTICQNNDWNISLHKTIVGDAPERLPEVFAKTSERLRKEHQYMPLVKRAKDYVEDNYKDVQLRFSKFATDNNVSLSYLSKIFKNETGVSLIDYLIEYRIKRSIELLCETKMKICEISEYVGYSSQHYYCEAFKKVMRMAPTEYRRSKY